MHPRENIKFKGCKSEILVILLFLLLLMLKEPNWFNQDIFFIFELKNIRLLF